MGRNVVGNFYEFIFEVGRNAGRAVEDLLKDVESVEGRDHYDRARALKKGAIVVTAHLGSFETAVASLRVRERHIHVVFRRDEVAQFERLRSAQRARLGVIEQPIEDGFDVWLRLREALARDEVVLMQADRVLPGQRGVRTRFCHGHIMMPVGPVKLALTTGAPIIPVFAIRSAPGLVRLFTEPAILVDPGSDHEGGMHPAMHALARVIESYVSRYPDQWLTLNPVFCEDTEGAGA
jgi:KDO2-lipid IV(A) lauroyltransferase